ncbi:MAG: glycosyltransferase 87 family protein [Gaiellaceae bacterium]
MSRLQRPALLAFFAVTVFLVAWALLHTGFWARDEISDVPLYREYGERIADGAVPYRDVALEYPPGALPVFVAPAAAGDADGYRGLFEALMWVCGAGLLLALAGALVTLGRRGVELAAPLLLAAAAPLALGSVVLSRFDLFPAALTTAALAAVLAGRERLGLGVLGLAVAAKVYPAVLVPLLLVHVWRRRGRREALLGAGAFAGVAAACFLPFVVLAPGGVWDAFSVHAARGLQIESLGAAFLLAVHQLGGVGLTAETSAGSQNLVGSGPDALAAIQTAVQVVAVVGIWVAFARAEVDRERLVRYSAAAVCAFVALGKVLSPQFLIWLVPLVLLVGGRRGHAAWALLGGAAVLTQIWFPYRYWSLVLDLDPAASWLVLARDVVLLGLVAVLVASRRQPAEAPATAALSAGRA